LLLPGGDGVHAGCGQLRPAPALIFPGCSGQRHPARTGTRPLDLSAIDFLYQLGEIATDGGDIRSHVFG
jgi:hypothetical protein